MILLQALVRLLSAVNAAVLTVGRQLAWIALAIMVIVILAQIFFRYVLGDALAWSEELARFFMLWMTGLIAPSAYRWGGFVAIDMLPQALPARLAATLNLALLSVAMMVLVVAIQLGWSDVFGFGGRFATASLKLPLSLVGGEDLVVRRAWMMASLLVCMILMTAVNVELVLRSLIRLIDPNSTIAAVPESAMLAGAD